MAKKRKTNSKSTDIGENKPAAAHKNDNEDEYNGEVEEEKQESQPGIDGGSDSYDDDSSSSDDDSLVLEGGVIRNPDASDSEEDDDDDDDDDKSVSSEEEEPEPTKKKAKKSNNNSAEAPSKSKKDKKNQQSKKPKKAANKPEMIHVEFLFCDMNERFFHGMKTLVHHHSIHSPHSSQLADLIIENVSVGTVLSTDEPNAPPHKKSSKSKSNAALPPPNDDNVFGFASVINVTTHSSNPCIQSLKSLCMEHCPSQHKKEMETVLSGKTKRPAGFFFQERMFNVPLEITEVVHQQLVEDMDWAVKNAEGGEVARKSLDFGAFVRMAPCVGSGGNAGANSVLYKYFDDEIFASNAEFVYTFKAPKIFEGDEEERLCTVIVMTKTGHRAAMKDLAKMINGN